MGGGVSSDDGRLGCRCDDVVFSTEDACRSSAEEGEKLVSGHNECQASDRNTDARHGGGWKLRLARRNVSVLLHGTLGRYRNSKRKM